MSRHPSPFIAAVAREQAEVTLELYGELGHVTRVRILLACADGPQSAKTIARDPDRVGHVAYHARVLERRGLIEVVERRPVRGALQVFYALTPKGRLLLR